MTKPFTKLIGSQPSIERAPRNLSKREKLLGEETRHVQLAPLGSYVVDFFYQVTLQATLLSTRETSGCIFSRFGAH